MSGWTGQPTRGSAFGVPLVVLAVTLVAGVKNDQPVWMLVGWALCAVVLVVGLNWAVNPLLFPGRGRRASPI